jgi:hypothetical protein
MVLKKWLVIVSFSLLSSAFFSKTTAQCSVCTKTTQQLGEKPAKGLNSAIIYLAFTPFAIAMYVGYRWWKNNRDF